jgi:hypothetical protein
VADGVPPRREGWPESVKFLFRRRTGSDLESTYVTVFEPFKGRPHIRSVSALPVDARGDIPVALQIDLGDRRHVVFNRLESSEDSGDPSHLTCEGVNPVDARAAVIELSGASDVGRTYLLDSGDTSPVHRKVREIDYEGGIVEVSSALPEGLCPSGAVAVVEGGRHASAVSVHRVTGTRTFSLGSEDLAEGTVHVTAAKGSRIEFRPRFVDFVEAGMTVVNEAGKTVGRLRAIDDGKATLSSSSLTLRDFPDRNRDGRRTCRFVVIGPGDSVTFHRSVRTGGKSR